jgi:hypothetical protein
MPDLVVVLAEMVNSPVRVSATAVVVPVRFGFEKVGDVNAIPLGRLCDHVGLPDPSVVRTELVAVASGPTMLVVPA